EKTGFFCDSARLSQPNTFGFHGGEPGPGLHSARYPQLKHDTSTLTRFHRSFPSVGPFLHCGDLTACYPHTVVLRGFRLRERGATEKKCHSHFERVSKSISANLCVSHFERQDCYAHTAFLLQHPLASFLLLTK